MVLYANDPIIFKQRLEINVILITLEIFHGLRHASPG